MRGTEKITSAHLERTGLVYLLTELGEVIW
jgi:hypothetical protein